MSLRESIDRDVTNVPVDPFDLDLTLRQGRRAVRRRRTIASVAGAAATVAVAAALSADMTGAGVPAPDAPVASQGSDDRCPAAGRTTPECRGQQFLDDHNVTLTPSGELVVRNGWTITQQVDDPIAPIAAVAVAVSNGTDAEWALIKDPDADRDVFSEHVDPENLPAAVTFDVWLDYATSRWTGKATTVVAEFDGAGKLAALPGWSIRQQATGLTMPAGYQGPPGVTAIMQLGREGSGGGWYLVRPSATGAEAFPVLAREGGMDNSIDGVLAYASSEYVRDQQGMVRPAP